MTQQKDEKTHKGKFKLSNLKDYYFPFAGIIITIIGIWLNNEANFRQRQLIQDANERQKQEVIDARKQKFLEYFLSNYSEESSLKQAAAFSLLKYVDDQVRKDLVYSLSASTSLSKESWEEIVKFKDVKLNFESTPKSRSDRFRKLFYKHTQIFV